ncbi:hypothetical protein QKU48_gp1360 [Fadolivirus algeromassiliense]|jgi:hypothetical protein|uniref:Uncharacterized protein n=1 Tax=Fadolivirus FV1/VV64 TaxID=3070911 RepID=A0A7D3R306_9VIRU|nr:hypothetical protein QKU48_gp1360 [Fadolivirus algeromassiliense]QKF94818.1 hypothetical protein Fadolivirus_1_1360 [Fadolivirus FV1/VV64]
MSFFASIFEEIERVQFKAFNEKIKDLKEVTRKQYLCIYLNTFLGNYLNEKMQKFDERCHQCIDSISLCSQEVEFFHNMVDFKVSDDYIDLLIKHYHTIKNLDRCQLGGNMLKCLEASKHLHILE